MVQAVDGYLLLSGGTQADIDAIVKGARAQGARAPALLLHDSTFQAFIPIDADNPTQFRQKVTQIIGGRNVTKAGFTVTCPVHPPPGLHMCPIKRLSFTPADTLAFALVNVAGPAAAVKAALAAIHAQGLTTCSIVKGSTVAQILVEVQAASQAAVDLGFVKLGRVPGIAHQKLGAHLPSGAGPGLDGRD